MNDYWKDDFSNGNEVIATANPKSPVQVVRSISSIESTNSTAAHAASNNDGSHGPSTCNSNEHEASSSLLVDCQGGSGRQHSIPKGYFMAICIVYVCEWPP